MKHKLQPEEIWEKGKQIRYIALDLDGTLTNQKKEVTPYTREMIADYIDRGGTVILASGRPTYGVMGVAEQLSLPEKGGYILSYNGGAVTDCRNGAVLFSQPMDASCIEKLEEQGRESGACLVTYHGGDILTRDPSDPYTVVEQKINGMAIREVSSVAEAVSFPVIKCLMTAAPDRRPAIEEDLQAYWDGRLTVTHSQPFFIEITANGIDKAHSLRQLMEKLGGSVSELAAFGDGMNDMPMIRCAGMGVAMENGEQALKDAADVVTLSNEEDGVACVVRELLR